MSLYDLNDKQQNPIGKKDYWKPFPVFKKSLLYEAFVDEIRLFLKDSNTINSSQAGSKIINKIKTSKPDLFYDVDQSLVGGLFGMTLWHYMADDTQSWRLHSLPKKEESDVSGTYYFKK